jgi:hypothetical protein
VLEWKATDGAFTPSELGPLGDLVITPERRLGRLSGAMRQDREEDTAVSLRAPHPHPPTVSLHDSLGQREAQPRPLVPPGDAGIELLEFAEEPGASVASS